MFGSCDKTFFGSVHLYVQRTGEESAACAEYQLTRGERVFDGTERRCLGYLAELGGGRILTFGKTVYLVVEQQYVDVDIASYGVYEMVTADSERVAVARYLPYAQLGIRDLDACGYGRGTSVNAVKPESLHIIREARRTTYTRNESKTLVSIVETFRNFGQSFLHRVENSVVAASGTPFHLLVALEIGRCIFTIFHCHSSLCFLLG